MQEIIVGIAPGVINGDARSLDYSSPDPENES